MNILMGVFNSKIEKEYSKNMLHHFSNIRKINNKQLNDYNFQSNWKIKKI